MKSPIDMVEISPGRFESMDEAERLIFGLFWYTSRRKWLHSEGKRQWQAVA
jgi:hypothetical protein